jgi:hypothetical protein
MSKSHAERRAINSISPEAERLAAVSCPHSIETACDNCRRQCQREIEDSQHQASARRLRRT